MSAARIPHRPQGAKAARTPDVRELPRCVSRFSGATQKLLGVLRAGTAAFDDSIGGNCNTADGVPLLATDSVLEHFQHHAHLFPEI